MWVELSYFRSCLSVPQCPQQLCQPFGDTGATDCPGFCISTYREVFILQLLLFLKKQLEIQICAHLSELLGSVFQHS